MSIKLIFSEYFEIEEKELDDHGALNICWVLPIFYGHSHKEAYYA